MKGSFEERWKYRQELRLVIEEIIGKDPLQSLEYGAMNNKVIDAVASITDYLREKVYEYAYIVTDAIKVDDLKWKVNQKIIMSSLPDSDLEMHGLYRRKVIQEQPSLI